MIEQKNSCCIQTVKLDVKDLRVIDKNQNAWNEKKRHIKLRYLHTNVISIQLYIVWSKICRPKKVIFWYSNRNASQQCKLFRFYICFRSIQIGKNGTTYNIIEDLIIEFEPLCRHMGNYYMQLLQSLFTHCHHYQCVTGLNLFILYNANSKKQYFRVMQTNKLRTMVIAQYIYW